MEEEEDVHVVRWVTHLCLITCCLAFSVSSMLENLALCGKAPTILSQPHIHTHTRGLGAYSIPRSTSGMPDNI